MFAEKLAQKTQTIFRRATDWHPPHSSVFKAAKALGCKKVTINGMTEAQWSCKDLDKLLDDARVNLEDLKVKTDKGNARLWWEDARKVEVF